ncbi:hypothetical protein, partial [Saccharophagus degradans]
LVYKKMSDLRYQLESDQYGGVVCEVPTHFYVIHLFIIDPLKLKNLQQTTKKDINHAPTLKFLFVSLHQSKDHEN